MRALLLLALVGCGKTTPPPTPASDTTATALPSATPQPALVYQPCGALDCRQYDKVSDAFLAALGRGPLVVAVGEAHAQKGKEGITSSTKHFTDEILPLMKDKASDLIVELMMPAKLPDGGACVQTAKAVQQKQTAVTSQQASTNQNEYVTMGEQARKLGVVPDLLRPTCDDLAAIDRAGPDFVAVSLETIKRLTAAKVQKQLERNKQTPADENKFVITYGGALHNDIVPKAELASFSFGPELSKYTSDRYVEIDLYVSDFIEDTDNWKKLDWYAHYDKARLGAKTTMFKLRDRSYVIILPRALNP